MGIVGGLNEDLDDELRESQRTEEEMSLGEEFSEEIRSNCKITEMLFLRWEIVQRVKKLFDQMNDFLHNSMVSAASAGSLDNRSKSREEVLA